MPEIVPPDSTVARRVITLLVAIVCVAVGVASMINAELGVAPYDVTSTGLAEVLGIPIGLAAVLLPPSSSVSASPSGDAWPGAR